ncbi:MAG: hypothetical protein H6581_29430 [Bacteroidia bacterium]|nr:hypothetical protein [Bacteroidia bacterium]
MNRKILVLSLCLLGLLPASLFAQFGLQVSHLNSSSTLSQRWQPANILNSEASFAYGADMQAWLQNSAFTLEGVFSNHLYLSQATRDRMVSTATNGGGLTAGLVMGLGLVNAKINGRTWSFSLDHYATLGVNFKSQGTLGLILLGNKPYAGQTVEEKNLYFSRYTVRNLGVGTGFDLGKLKLGVRVKFIQGFRLRQLKNTSYSLFTEEDGTQIHIQADYDYYQMKKTTGLNPFSFQGFGAGLDLGARYEVNDKMNVVGAVTGLGFVAWPNMDRFKANVNVDFKGIEISSLFGGDIATEAQASVDSLISLLLPDSASEAAVTPTATIIRAGIEYQIGENGRLYPELIYTPFKQGAFTRLPLLNCAYQHSLTDWLTLGGNVFVGGTNKYGFGLMADADFALGQKYGLNVNVNSDAILGGLVPAAAGGVSVYGGLCFYMLGNGGGM